MNKVAIAKYQDMSGLAAGLVAFTQTLQAKCTEFYYRSMGSSKRFSNTTHTHTLPLTQKDGEFQPYLDKLDQVEKGLTDLEQTVALLDDYTRKLGNEEEEEESFLCV